MWVPWGPYSEKRGIASSCTWNTPGWCPVCFNTSLLINLGSFVAGCLLEFMSEHLGFSVRPAEKTSVRDKVTSLTFLGVSFYFIRHTDLKGSFWEYHVRNCMRKTLCKPWKVFQMLCFQFMGCFSCLQWAPKSISLILSQKWFFFFFQIENHL